MAEGPEVSLGQDAQAGRIGDAEGDADDLWQAGRLGEAAEAYRRLLERVPERLDLWQRAGRLSLLGNDLPSAVHRLAHALNNGLRSQSVWAALADAYYDIRLGLGFNKSPQRLPINSTGSFGDRKACAR